MNPYLRLVRAPAAFTVPGDTAAGARGRLRGRRLLLPLSSVALYWAGMAANDWADRAVDAVERPERPIPQGQVTAGQALAVAAGLTGVGVGLAAVAGGRASLVTAGALAAAVWSYDALVKDTPLGPVVMAACRGLDVLLGAEPGRLRAALPAAGAVAAHTWGVTALSRGEVHGTSRSVVRAALACTAAAALTAGARGPRAGLGAFVYAAFVGRAQRAALADTGAGAVRAATVAGIHGVVPLQAALIAPHSPRSALVVSLALPLARAFGRKVGPT